MATASSYMSTFDITEDALLTGSLTPVKKINNGLVFELYSKLKSKGLQREVMVNWLAQLTQNSSSTINTQTLMSKVNKLLTKDKGMRGQTRQRFRDEVFHLPVSTASSSKSVPAIPVTQGSFQKTVQKRLTSQLLDCNYDLVDQVQNIEQEKKEVKQAKKQVSQERKNLKRRLERTLSKSGKSKEELESLNKRVRLMEKEVKGLKREVSVEKKKRILSTQKLSKYVKTNKKMREKLYRTEKAHKDIVQHLEDQRLRVDATDNVLLNENHNLRDQLRQEQQNSDIWRCTALWWECRPLHFAGHRVRSEFDRLFCADK